SLLETDGAAGKSLLTAKSAHNAVPPDLKADLSFSAIQTVFWRSGTSGLSPQISSRTSRFGRIDLSSNHLFPSSSDLNSY
ncbi:MAG: hypothetical protein VXB74_17850, partial [Deltaproteobacteria bacterium]